MRNQRNSAKKKIKSLGFILVVGLIVFILVNRFTKNNNQRVDSSLENVVQNTLRGTKGIYGIVIKNLKTGEAYFANEHRVYQPGSLYKIWIMATAFDQIKNGKLKEDEVLKEDVIVLNNKFNIASEEAEMTEGTITLAVNQALRQMLTISHNYASLLLTTRIKHSPVRYFLTQNGFRESSLGEPPKTTPYDIALFFEKLYKGKLTNLEYSNKMLSLLKEQKLNDKLPKYLPQNTIIAHKTGEIDFFTHDAGIIYSPNGDYLIVVLSESDSPPQAKERIAEVSKAVYDYFQNKNKL